MSCEFRALGFRALGFKAWGFGASGLRVNGLVLGPGHKTGTYCRGRVHSRCSKKGFRDPMDTCLRSRV